jgi:hypothetical protein
MKNENSITLGHVSTQELKQKSSFALEVLNVTKYIVDQYLIYGKLEKANSM